MTETYESSIGDYSFIMHEGHRIEVWRNDDLSSPFYYINVEDGSIDTEKKFHLEIGDWYMKNC
jgi:hypothetical protein